VFRTGPVHGGSPSVASDVRCGRGASVRAWASPGVTSGTS